MLLLIYQKRLNRKSLKTVDTMIITKTIKEMRKLRSGKTPQESFYDFLGVKTTYYIFGIPIYQNKDYTK